MAGPAMTEMPPLVSVVVPFFNAERFFEEAIESVFAQRYGHWELLLVDDGSNDGSTAIAKRYARQRPDRVRYLEHPGHANRGAASARNLGVRHARGRYVAFLDADDVWLPRKLEHQVELMERHPEAGMVCGASLYWYSWSGQLEDAARDKTVLVGAAQDTVIRPPALLTTLYPLGKGTPPCPSGLLLRRCVVEAVGGFDENFHGVYQLYEDQVFLGKVYLSVPIYVASLCDDRYRKHAESCVSRVSNAGQYHIVRKRFLDWLGGYLSERGCRELEIHRALQDALWPYRHPILAFLVEYHRHPVRGMRRLLASALRGSLPAPVFLWLRARFGTGA